MDEGRVLERKRTHVGDEVSIQKQHCPEPLTCGGGRTAVQVRLLLLLLLHHIDPCVRCAKNPGHFAQTVLPGVLQSKHSQHWCSACARPSR